MDYLLKKYKFLQIQTGNLINVKYEIYSQENYCIFMFFWKKSCVKGKDTISVYSR